MCFWENRRTSHRSREQVAADVRFSNVDKFSNVYKYNNNRSEI